MKFLADENIGLAVVEFLRKIGHDTSSIIETNPGVNDATVLKQTVKSKRILITADTDFGEPVFHSGESHLGVILLRLDDERNENKIRVLRKLLSTHTDDLSGNFVVVTDTSVRIRRTP